MKLVQIIPVDRPTYAVFSEDKSKKFACPVPYLALTEDGRILPILKNSIQLNERIAITDYDIEDGSSKNYIGLWQEPQVTDRICDFDELMEGVSCTD